MSADPLKPPPPPENRRGSWLSVVLAMVVGLGFFVVFSFLTLGFLTPVVVIGGVLLGIACLHYFIWGWWLGGVLRAAEEEEEAAQEE